MINTESGASSSIKPLGFRTGLDRAHLLAQILGASGSVKANLVSMYSSPNRSEMQSFETRARNYIAGCHALYYTATPEYGGGSLPVRAVQLTAWGTGYFSTETIINEP